MPYIDMVRLHQDNTMKAVGETKKSLNLSNIWRSESKYVSPIFSVCIRQDRHHVQLYL
jgi:hypothetical protein